MKFQDALIALHEGKTIRYKINKGGPSLNVEYTINKNNLTDLQKSIKVEELFTDSWSIESKTAAKLTKLADFLENLPVKYEKKFDMAAWVQNVQYDDDRSFSFNPEDNKCGTAACALGWATNVFPKDLAILDRNVVAVGGDTNESSINAAVKFFEITMAEALDIFDYDCSHTDYSIMGVVRRIRKVANYYFGNAYVEI